MVVVVAVVVRGCGGLGSAVSVAGGGVSGGWCSSGLSCWALRWPVARLVVLWLVLGPVADVVGLLGLPVASCVALRWWLGCAVPLWRLALPSGVSCGVGVASGKWCGTFWGLSASPAASGGLAPAFRWTWCRWWPCPCRWSGWRRRPCWARRPRGSGGGRWCWRSGIQSGVGSGARLDGLAGCWWCW